VQDRQRVADAVDDYAATGQGDVARLRNRQREWRLRIGDIRVIFTVDPDERLLTVLSVDQRDSAYR
jgi:mRNA-degrading endonuclease RelE of RelBE toxin-antitoxin system